jgi:NDP-sugar pyrophosphorylase family protein
MQAVILAGGLATRMRPRTLTTPKLLLDVAGRPFVDWQLEKLRACGFTEIVLCIAHLGEQIVDYVGDGDRFGVRVVYSSEGPELLGTAGALHKALPRLAETFLVTYGDSYLPFDYAGPLRMLREHADCDAVMSIYKNEGRWDESNVATDGTWVTRYEKKRPDLKFDFIDYGALAFRRRVVAELPRREDGAHAGGLELVQRDLAEKKLLRAFVARDRFFEIGSPEGLTHLERVLNNRGLDGRTP